MVEIGPKREMGERREVGRERKVKTVAESEVRNGGR